MGEQVYVADNLAFFPFQVQDEPLFVIHQIDIIVSVAGSNLMQSFKEVSCAFVCLVPFFFQCPQAKMLLVSGFGVKASYFNSKQFVFLHC